MSPYLQSDCAIAVPRASDGNIQFVIPPDDPRYRDWLMVLPASAGIAGSFDLAAANEAWSRAAGRTPQERDAFLVAILEAFEAAGDDFDRLLSLGIQVANQGGPGAEVPAIHWLLATPLPRRLDIVATLLTTAWRRDGTAMPVAEEGVGLLLRACEITAWENEAGYSLAQALDAARRATLPPPLLARVEQVLAECVRRLLAIPTYARLVRQAGWVTPEGMLAGSYNPSARIDIGGQDDHYRMNLRATLPQTLMEKPVPSQSMSPETTPSPAWLDFFRVWHSVGVPSAPYRVSYGVKGRFEHEARRVAVIFSQERGGIGGPQEWRADFSQAAYRRCLAVASATPLPLNPPLYGGGLDLTLIDESGMVHAGSPANHDAWQDLLHTIRANRPGRLRLPWNRW